MKGTFPLKSMKTVPAFTRHDGGAAFIAFVMYISSKQGAWDRFEKDTGLKFPDHRDLTKADEPFIAAFCDWVVINLWGVGDSN